MGKALIVVIVVANLSVLSFLMLQAISRTWANPSKISRSSKVFKILTSEENVIDLEDYLARFKTPKR